MTMLAARDYSSWYSDADEAALPEVEPTGVVERPRLRRVYGGRVQRQAVADGSPVDTLSSELGAADLSTESGAIASDNLQPTEVLAEWSGYVTEIMPGGLAFAASLTGVRGNGVQGEEDDAIIPIEDVSEWDRELLHPGSFFRLCVNHEVTSSGQPRRYTQVIFRRLPAYRQQDLDSAVEKGRELARGLRVE